MDIGKGTSEKPPGALDRKSFNDVDEFATTVVAAAWVAFGVFVGQDRALRCQYSTRDEVFAGDQLDLPSLAHTLVNNCRRHFGIGPGDGVAYAGVGDGLFERR